MRTTKHGHFYGLPGVPINEAPLNFLLLSHPQYLKAVCRTKFTLRVSNVALFSCEVDWCFPVSYCTKERKRRIVVG